MENIQSYVPNVVMPRFFEKFIESEILKKGFSAEYAEKSKKILSEMGSCRVAGCFSSFEFEFSGIKTVFSKGEFTSEVLQKHLKGKNQVVLYAISLACGETPDNDLNIHLLRSFICSSLLYYHFDRMKTQAETRYSLKASCHYCPGYEGWAIEENATIALALDAQTCGISALPSGMLKPLHSICGALISSDENENACSKCTQKNCYYRGIADKMKGYLK